MKKRVRWFVTISTSGNVRGMKLMREAKRLMGRVPYCERSEDMVSNRVPLFATWEVDFYNAPSYQKHLWHLAERSRGTSFKVSIHKDRGSEPYYLD